MREALRDIVSRDSRCNALFEQAVALSDGISTDRHGQFQLVPFFTDHSRSHFAAVERILDELLFGGSATSNAFTPTAEEAMYLLSAAWTHDIGMWYGIFDGETPDRFEADWDQIRNEHETRTSSYLQKQWLLNCDWTSEERILLSTVCRFHRRKHSLETFTPDHYRTPSGSFIRLRELAALLRLADACHIDSSRCPLDLRSAFLAMGMPMESLKHWALPLQVSRVEYNHDSLMIRPVFMLPAPREYGTVKVDFAPAADTVVRDLLSELKGVQPYLAHYSNVAFRGVEKYVIQSQDVFDTHNLLLSIWPLLLRHVATPSEAASLMAVLVMRCVTGKETAPRAQLEEILGTAKRLHPFDVLLHKLAREVEKYMAPSTSVIASDVRRCKESYLQRRKDACRIVGQTAAASIKESDVLLVGAYSHNIMSLLREVRRSHRGPILVVAIEDAEFATLTHWDRVHQELLEARMDHSIVSLASLPMVLKQRKTIESRLVFLVGCYGIIDNKNVLAPVGSQAIAQMVSSEGGTVYVLAEAEKIAAGDELSVTLENLLRSSVRTEVVGNQSGGLGPLCTACTATVDVMPAGTWHDVLGPKETFSLMEDAAAISVLPPTPRNRS